MNPIREQELVVMGGCRVVLSVCAEGCYKHYVKGVGWVCCKCGG